MNIIKGALIFLGGVAVGGGSAALILKEKYKSIADREIAEIKEHYNEKIGREVTKRKETEDKEKVREIIDSAAYAVDGVMDYSAYSSKKAESEHPREEYPDEPVIINEDDFAEANMTFDKIEADYYMDDGALVNELDELMNIDSTIGYDNLESFLDDETIETIYIRNTKEACDYMVTKRGGSYSDITGIGGDGDNE